MTDLNLLHFGAHEGVPNDDYHAWRGAIGSTGLKAVRRSPAYYFGQYLDPRKPAKEETDGAARFFGHITHCALFEHDKLNERYIVGPDVNKNTNVWKAHKAECEARGAIPCDSSQYISAINVRRSVMSDPDIARWFDRDKARGEVTVVALDPVTGTKCKVRCDLLYYASPTEVVIIDGKSYKSVDAHQFTRQVASMDYDLQTAFYYDVVSWAGFTVMAHLYLGFENEYPHQARLFELDKASFENGRRKYRSALNTYAECMRTGVWPGIGAGIQTISLPEYAMEYNDAII